MLNHIDLMGRLTRQPELRMTGSNIPVASFTLACDRDYKDKSTGERATDFIDCVAWRGTAECRKVSGQGPARRRLWPDGNGELDRQGWQQASFYQTPG